MTPSLYVHIPFCKAKCAYCDFFSVKAPKYIEDKYIECVINEARYYAKLYGVTAWKTVYIGGGTPSLLSCSQIETLLRLILDAPAQGGASHPPLEVTFEANPESLTEEKLLCLAKCGVNRLSVGVQSLRDVPLRAVRRITTAEETLRVLSLIQRVWRARVSYDVMAGLPGLRAEDFCADLRRILSFKPGHISLYTLTLEEGTALFESVAKREVAFDPDEADDEWLSGRDILSESGYKQYEVSSFCLDGEESLHNLSYWEQEDYIGVGAGAVGTIYGEESVRWTDTHDIALYEKTWGGSGCGALDEGALGSARSLERIPLNTREEEFLMTGLRTSRGINSKTYHDLFSSLSPWYGNLEKRLSVIRKSALNVTLNADGTSTYSLTRDALLFLNRILLKL